MGDAYGGETSGGRARKRGAPAVSFEFFPPATPEMTYKLWGAASTLAALGPRFVSVTYGAGGATRRRTIDAVAALRRNARLPVAGHLTCVGDTRKGVLDVARAYQRHGVSHVVALRGDPPKGEGAFRPAPGGFQNALELIAAIKRETKMKVVVGCYPERHPEAADAAADIAWLKRKQDAGADLAITQFFFDNELFFRFRDAARAAGVTIPLIPGLLPIENFERMAKFAAGCGASVPAQLAELFAAAYARPEEDRAEATRLLAASVCAGQAEDLVQRGGVEHLHFYTLNSADLTYNVCRALGVEAGPLALAAVG